MTAEPERSSKDPGALDDTPPSEWAIPRKSSGWELASKEQNDARPNRPDSKNPNAESPEALRNRADSLLDEMMLGGADLSAADHTGNGHAPISSAPPSWSSGSTPDTHVDEDEFSSVDPYDIEYDGAAPANSVRSSFGADKTDSYSSNRTPASESYDINNESRYDTSSYVHDGVNELATDAAQASNSDRSNAPRNEALSDSFEDAGPHDAGKSSVYGSSGYRSIYSYTSENARANDSSNVQRYDAQPSESSRASQVPSEQRTPGDQQSPDSAHSNGLRDSSRTSPTRPPLDSPHNSSYDSTFRSTDQPNDQNEPPAPTPEWRVLSGGGGTPQSNNAWNGYVSSYGGASGAPGVTANQSQKWQPDLYTESETTRDTSREYASDHTSTETGSGSMGAAYDQPYEPPKPSQAGSSGGSPLRGKSQSRQA